MRTDARILAVNYGEQADPADTRAMAAAAKRYYALAMADDGGRACASITAQAASIIPADIGRDGYIYLHSAKTCAAVLTRLFRHRHPELRAPVTVTGALRRGEHGFALLYSTAMPATILAMRHEHGTWIVDAPIGGRLLVAEGITYGVR